MKQPRTVMFALAAQGEYLNLLKSSLAALANLLCLGAEHGPLPRLGICALELAPKTGKVQLKVKLRPSELNLYDFHAAAHKIQATTQQQTLENSLDGQQTALALKSLTQVLLQDSSTNQSNKIVVLVTDHLMRASDFETYLSMNAGKRISLKILVLCDATAAQETSAAACDWEGVEARYPGLTLTIVPVAGKVAVQYVARALLSTCAEEAGFQSTPTPVSLEFPIPFLGNFRALQLESHSEIRPLNFSLSHCIVCACHSAPLALHGAPTDASSATTPLSLQRAFRCPITGNVLSPVQCVQDGRTLCVGNTAAGVLHSSTPLTLSSPAAANISGNNNNSGGGDVLRVLSKCSMNSPNAGLVLGPSITLKPISNSISQEKASVKVAIDGEMVMVTQEQLFTIVTADLKAKNQALMVESTCDLHSGGGENGLFKFHYMLIPAQNSYGSVFIALRLASMEELAHQTVPSTASNGGGSKEEEAPPAAVVQAVHALLGKVPEEPNKVMPRSSRVHETLEMLIGEAHPPLKLGSANSALVSGSGGGGATGGDGGGSKAGAAAPAAVAPSAPAGRRGGIPQGSRGNSAAPQAAGGTRGKGAAPAPAAAPKRRR